MPNVRLNILTIDSFPKCYIQVCENSLPEWFNLELQQPLKEQTLTSLYIVCKSFILNVNLIDQATLRGQDKHIYTHTHTHTHTNTHTHTLMSPSSHPLSLPSSQTCTPLHSSVVGSKRWVEWQPTLRMANQPDTHTQNRGQACVNWGVEASWGAPPMHCANLCVCVCVCVPCCCVAALAMLETSFQLNKVL